MADLTGVWPRETPRPYESDGEGLVYKAFKNGLPDGWTAWHSLKIRSATGDNGEADFVVAIPDLGVIIVEVKDGIISVRDGQWYQNGRRMKMPPRSQALRFAGLLQERLGDAGCRAPFAVVTVFPDTPADNLPTQDDMRSRLFVGQSLPQMCEVLRREAGRMIDGKFGCPAGPWIERIHQMWGETWRPRMTLGNRHEYNEERRVMMDDDQRVLLDQTEKTRLALIYGMAGSGKTMLAREKAIHAAREGRRAMVLTFTDPLATGLAQALRQQGIAVWTVRRFAQDLLKKAGRPGADGTTPEFWDGVCQRAVTEALPPADELPDLVIVDEAQDFSDGDWALIERLCAKEDGVHDCWAFCDMTQSYWPERKPPDWLKHGMVFDLEGVYRCPPSIMALAGAIVGGIPVADGSQPLKPPGVDKDSGGIVLPESTMDAILDGIRTEAIKIIETRDDAAIPHAVETEVAALFKGHLEPGDIAILSLVGRDAEGSITKRQRIFVNKTAVAADSERSAERLVADTCLRFKGLERPAVIVTDLNLPAARKNLAVRLFIAMTRAQDFLRIVAPASAIDEVPVLRAVINAARATGESTK
ncbi:MAG TPA: NERD domain-containing protein [Myxococcota bacterium]|nr:NERD domain-containing protein [Myxococcota bacterium]